VGTGYAHHEVFSLYPHPAMTLAFISLVAITLGIALVFGLGFGAMYILWTLFQPPETPDDSEER
jgi:cell division protein FtsX